MNIGDKLVYNSHGICIIKKIDTRKLGNKNIRFIILESQNKMIIMVPEKDFSTLTRSLIEKGQAKNILENINNFTGINVENSTWNRRYRDYMEKIKSGNIEELVFVYKSLNKLRIEKDLSFGERKMLDACKELIYSEINEVLSA